MNSAKLQSFPERQPWYLWANVLSLDAPLVALAWQDLFARSLHVPLGPAPRLVTAGCVWLAYAGDRLLDGSAIPSESLVTPRHRFARTHRVPLALGWTALLSITAYAALWMLREELVRSGLALAGVVAAYFAAVHWPGRKTFPSGCKEVCVAALFSAGTVTFVAAKLGRLPLGLALPALFWLLVCWLNCLGIGCWEIDRDSAQRQDSLALRWPPIGRQFSRLALLVAAAALAAGLMPGSGGFRPVYLCAAASSFLLAALDHFSHAFAVDELRVGADLALLTPLLFLPFGPA